MPGSTRHRAIVKNTCDCLMSEASPGVTSDRIAQYSGPNCPSSAEKPGSE
jgi:hypothetical protein